MLDSSVRANQTEVVRDALVRHPGANAKELRRYIHEETGCDIERIQARLGDLNNVYDVIKTTRVDGSTGFRLGAKRTSPPGRRALHLTLPCALDAKEAARLQALLMRHVVDFVSDLTGTSVPEVDTSDVDFLLAQLGGGDE